MKNKKIKYSVIIPTYNEEKNLPSLLKDLKKQTTQDFEIIVADNKSKDKTREFAKKYKARIVQGGLPGPGRNSGAKAAKGEVLVFLDADVRIPKNYLKDNGAYLKKQKKDFGVSRISVQSKDIRDKIIFKLQDWWLCLTGRFWPYTVGFATWIKRDLFEKLNGYDTTLKLGEDLDLGTRAIKNKAKFAVLPVFLKASARRFERDGRLRLFIKVIWGAIKLRLGFVPNNLTYEWGGYDKKPKKKKRKQRKK